MRVLKRPMFRKGGSTNRGIMTGLTDRKQYKEGTPSPREQRIATRSAEDLAILNRLAPMSTDRGIDDLAGMTGLNLLSGQFGGGDLIQNIAGSATDPYKQFMKRQQYNKALGDQRKTKSVLGSIGQERAIEIAKAKGKDKFQKEFSPDRQEYELFKQFSDPNKGTFKKDINQIYPKEMARFYPKTSKTIEQVDNFKGKPIKVFPHDISGNKVNFDADRMIAGVVYYRPDNNKTYEKDSEKKILIEYDTFSGKIIREIPL
tara:strand:- start:1038 stop:1814 length:777 start_codon:yes stop_codon:yes gene_type:complete